MWTVEVHSSFGCSKKKKETTTGKNVSFKAFLPDPTSALLLYLEDLQINCPNNHLKTSGVARLADNLSKG